MWKRYTTAAVAITHLIYKRIRAEKKKVAAELLDARWKEIKQLLEHEAPEIEIEEEQVEDAILDKLWKKYFSNKWGFRSSTVSYTRYFP